LIEKGANLETKDPKGYSLLQIAAEKGNLELVKFLIGRGLDLNYQAEGKSSYFLAF
jgi:ankyrin repeat protein